MERTYIRALKERVGEEVSISGWVDARRDHGKIVFLDIRDGSGLVQAVASPAREEALLASQEIRGEWVVRIEGKVGKRPENMVNPEMENGDIEIGISALTVLGRAQELPFDKDGELNFDTYLDYLPLTLRTGRARDIFTLQATIIDEFRKSLQRQEFMEFQAPALAGGDAEGGAAAFQVSYYYDQKAFLATSPQFYKQIMVGVFERVFSTPKVFRGEKHSTTRHLSEYSSLDFEMGFIEDHRDVMGVLERVIREIAARLSREHADIFKRLGSELPLLPEEIPTLKLREAQEILEREYGTHCSGAPDLEPEHERQICQWANKEHKSDFVFITHYPSAKRPFYTYEDEEDPGYTKSFDLLFRGLEITTGGQRIHDHETLVEKIKERGGDPASFSFYLQAFRYGMPPHGGSATGLERLTARMLNLKNVKEAALFPRDLNRIDTRLSKDG